MTVNGPGLLDVTVWRQKSSITVHMVNLTNPMTMKGPYRDLIPVGGQDVRVRLPGGKKPVNVRLLSSDQSPDTREASGVLEVRIPSILVHEVLAIDL